MKLFVKIKPSAKQNLVEETGEGFYNVWTKEPAYEGKANAALINLLAEHFKVAKSRVSIIGGKKSKIKIIEIED
jgi:uncharacterized protein